VSGAAVEARWVGGLRFEAVGRGEGKVLVDGDSGAGTSPMETLLVSLAACMGSDVVDILNKGRVAFDGLVVRVEGDRRPVAPRRYTAIRLTCAVEGLADGAEEKLRRAVDLSREKYCSVLHSLRRDLEVTIRTEIG
jgi:putative redox protein